MQGHIESYDIETQTGVVKSGDNFFPFHIGAWQAEAPPEAGDDVRFEVNANAAVDLDLVGAYLEALQAVKYRYLAAFLALLLGWAGVHRFYLGFYRLGIMQMALTAFLLYIGAPGFVFLWSFCECVLLSCGLIFKDAKGRPLK